MPEDRPSATGRRISKLKRTRINFTAQQLETMEAVFARTQYPDVTVLETMGTTMDLGIEKVCTWFQNRRSKFRRESKKGHIDWMRSQLFTGSGSQTEAALNVVQAPPGRVSPEHVLSNVSPGDGDDRSNRKKNASMSQEPYSFSDIHPYHDYSPMTSSLTPHVTSSFTPHVTSSFTPHMMSSVSPSMMSPLTPHMTSSLKSHMTSSLTPHVTSSLTPHMMASSLTPLRTSPITPPTTSPITPPMTSPLMASMKLPVTTPLTSSPSMMSPTSGYRYYDYGSPPELTPSAYAAYTTPYGSDNGGYHGGGTPYTATSMTEQSWPCGQYVTSQAPSFYEQSSYMTSPGQFYGTGTHAKHKFSAT